MTIKIKRVYEHAEKGDGIRILVDRLWPRGLTKEKVNADIWLKEIAPSTELRKWFGHDPAKWKKFQARYTAELRHNDDLIEQIVNSARRGNVTLLYAARDEIHNEAAVIKRFLESK